MNTQMSRERTRKRRFMSKLRKRRKLCSECGRRPALFIRRMRIHGGRRERLGRNVIVKTDRQHDLCPQCKRALNSRMYAGRFSK
jgi:hypothetical protein